MKNLLLTFFILHTCHVQAATFALHSPYPETVLITIEGPLERGDTDKFRRILTTVPKGHEIESVNINSTGGDVDTAIELGRIIRRKELSVAANYQCFSSCVLIFAGGVIRSSPAFTNPKNSSDVGIHRIYFESLSPSMGMEKINSLRNSYKEKISKYLREMNVSPRLVEAMEAIPPERMRILTARELEEFGLGPRDPSYEEKGVAASAARFGLSSIEYRRRSTVAERKCQETVDARPYETLISLMECRTRVIEGR